MQALVNVLVTQIADNVFVFQCSADFQLALQLLCMTFVGNSSGNLHGKEMARVTVLRHVDSAKRPMAKLLAADALEALPASKQARKAESLRKQFMGQKGMDGVGQQDRTSETQKLWDSANVNGDVGKGDALEAIRTEATAIRDMLAIDAFPRFLQSDAFNDVMTGGNKKKKGGLLSGSANEKADKAAAEEAESVLNKAGVQLPKDADEWLNSFVTIAETLPASIVISDMTIAGAPMVFVNDEFAKVTGYDKSEATGRNCRFLQGPDTEKEAIEVIRRTLGKGEDCHVKLTNYRKNGEKFQNLLTMRPVFDADGVYRYVIGVQFEIVEDEDLKARVSLLERLQIGRASCRERV